MKINLLAMSLFISTIAVGMETNSPTNSENNYTYDSVDESTQTIYQNRNCDWFNGDTEAELINNINSTKKQRKRKRSTTKNNNEDNNS